MNNNLFEQKIKHNEQIIMHNVKNIKHREHLIVQNNNENWISQTKESTSPNN
jgi:hypothetical protein